MRCRRPLPLVVLIALTMPAIAQGTKPPSDVPTAHDVTRALEVLGFTDVDPGTVAVKDGILLATGVRAYAPAAAGTRGKAATVGAVTISAVSERDSVRTAGTVDLERIAFEGISAERVVFSDLAIPETGARARFTAMQAQSVGLSGTRSGGMTIEGVRLSQANWRGDVALTSTVQLRGFVVSDGKGDLAAHQLPDMPRKLDIDLTSAFDPKGGRLTLDDVSVWIGDRAVLKGAIAFSGIDEAKLAAIKDVSSRPSLADEKVAGRIVLPLVVALTETRLEALTLRLTDKGLVSGLLDARARAMGVPRQLVASAIIAQAVSTLRARGAGPELASEVEGALARFLADPRSLTFRAEPAPGKGNLIQSMMRIQGGQATARDFGIRVTANDGTP